MSDDAVIPCLLFLLAVVLAVGATLRILSTVVQQYAAQQGSPRLGLSVRIIGLSLLAPGLSLGFLGGLCLAGLAQDDTETRLAASMLLVFVFLMAVAGFAWWW